MFLRFVLRHLPSGLVGLLIAVILCAAMSANAAALSVARRHHGGRPLPAAPSGAPDVRTLRRGSLVTVVWGVVAIGFASFAALLDNLIQAVNILGSLFYGPMLGVFVVGFFLRRVGGRAGAGATLAARR